MVFNFRDGKPVLGSLYAVALVEFVILLPTITAKLTANLAQMGIDAHLG